MIQSDSLPRLLKAKGRSMPRQKHQRPEVYATGTREKLWKAEWRQYYVGADGQQRSRHKSKTWSRAQFTKTEAQAQFDALLRDQERGGLKADGSLTVETFWKEIYYPIHQGKLEPNSRRAYESSWKTHIQPALGAVELQNVKRHHVETVLVTMANSGRSRATVRLARALLDSLFAYATENDYIPKNPAYKVTVPKSCTKPKETRSLNESEVRRLWESTTGRDRLMWRVLVMTGARIGEVLALTKSDVQPEGLCIDESAFEGQAARTKNGKTRFARLPVSLRHELEDWTGTVSGELLFSAADGSMLQRNGAAVSPMLNRARKAAGIPDLTFRMCRTTFATLYNGDPRDAQDILGHSTLDLTMRVYRKPIAPRQQAGVEELDARLSGKVVKMKKRA